MNIVDMIVYLRQQLVLMRDQNDRKALSDLLSTFKILTKASFESGDKALTALLVDLTDSARDMYMGKSPNGKLPTEDMIRSVAQVSLYAEVGTGITRTVPVVSNHAALHEEIENTLPDDDTHPIIPIHQNILEATEPVVLSPAELVRQSLEKVSNRDWTDHRLICDGTAHQMRAYTVMYDRLMVFHHLVAHHPMWVGDYPLNIDVQNSTINVLFNPLNLRLFLTDVRTFYSEQQGFRLTWQAINRTPTILVHFTVGEFNVELFAQARPVDAQNEFVYMKLEARLLAIGGEDARCEIIALKESGMKTKDAFAKYFEIKDENLHEALLTLAQESDMILHQRFER